MKKNILWFAGCNYTLGRGDNCEFRGKILKNMKIDANASLLHTLSSPFYYAIFVDNLKSLLKLVDSALCLFLYIYALPFYNNVCVKGRKKRTGLVSDRFFLLLGILSIWLYQIVEWAAEVALFNPHYSSIH